MRSWFSQAESTTGVTSTVSTTTGKKSVFNFEVMTISRNDTIRF